MKRWKVFRSFFKRGKGTSVAQPVDEPVMKVENGSHMVGEHDRSTKLEDLKFRREKLLARALAQMQSINSEVQAHLRNADINVSNDVKSEPLTPPTKDMGWTQYLWTLQPWVLLTLCLNITPVIVGCASATSN